MVDQAEDFRRTTLPGIGKQVLRIGVAGNYGLKDRDIHVAAEHGANYWLWGPGFSKVTVGLRKLLRQDRQGHVVALLEMGLWAGQVRRRVDRALRELDTDYIDVFKLGWLGRTARYTPAIADTLLQLKQEGKIRAIGTSIHDRQQAARLTRESVIDVFMLRYNAKHPGAEQDVFPHLAERQPAVVTYTTTSWRQLLRPIKGIEMPPWPGKQEAPVPPLTPELCYRFSLTNPHIHVVLTGPRNGGQLVENLQALDAGPLSDDELAWVRAYGRKVKAKRRLDYF